MKVLKFILAFMAGVQDAGTPAQWVIDFIVLAVMVACIVAAYLVL